MPDGPENRVERIVSDLLHGRRLRLRGGDAEEKDAIIAAARLAAAGQGVQRMHPAFRKRMAHAIVEGIVAYKHAVERTDENKTALNGRNLASSH